MPARGRRRRRVEPEAVQHRRRDVLHVGLALGVRAAHQHERVVPACACRSAGPCPAAPGSHGPFRSQPFCDTSTRSGACSVYGPAKASSRRRHPLHERQRLRPTPQLVAHRLVLARLARCRPARARPGSGTGGRDPCSRRGCRPGTIEAIDCAGSSSASQPSRSSQRLTNTSWSSRQKPWSESRIRRQSSGRRVDQLAHRARRPRRSRRETCSPTAPRPRSICSHRKWCSRSVPVKAT